MLRRKIDRRFKPPNTLSENKIKSYMSRIQVEMRIGRNGRLNRVRISKSSGNRTFDSVLLNAIRSAAPYPSPPDKIWRAVANGITITF
jgi:TonB family protein